MRKNIVIFSDGTGQEGGEGNNTNIYKMFNMIEDRTAQQVAFYDPGIGTGWRKVTGNIGGMGMSRNIRQCYRFIFDHYEAGDQLYLFGFSRGAATVRSLSCFIHHFGILPKSRPELIDKAYKIYKKSNRNNLAHRANEFVGRHHNIWTRVKFLGVFDTVAALGLPFKTASAFLDGLPGFRHQFHDFGLSESVDHAYQALAIDDERKTFRPILWDAEIALNQTVKQVWFGGMHTDVGGGYPEFALSDIPLTWMTRQAVHHGLRVFAGHKVMFSGDENGIMHNSRGGKTGKLYRHEVRHWDTKRTDRPIVHESVIERTKNRDNLDEPKYQPWILNKDPELEYEVEPWVKEEGLSPVEKIKRGTA